jgi:hypothetical protein
MLIVCSVSNKSKASLISFYCSSDNSNLLRLGLMFACGDVSFFLINSNCLLKITIKNILCGLKSITLALFLLARSLLIFRIV